MRGPLHLLLLAAVGACEASPDEASTVCTMSDPAAAVMTSSSTWVPFVDGAFTRVYEPPGTRYLNDHTLVRGADGRWHLYGITDSSAGRPSAERSLLHATAPRLEGPWSPEVDILTATSDEQVLWAPFAFDAGAGRWVMFYYSNATPQYIDRAESTDLDHWTRTALAAPGGRDPFVLRVGDAWYLYSVGVDAMARGEILVSTSRDLVAWSAPRVVLRDPVPCFGWGNLESPTVVVRGDEYYLFVTRTGAAPVDYARTVVFSSRAPDSFTWSPVTELVAHAAEVVTVEAQAYLTSAGWTSSVGERGRGLTVARLGWARRGGT